ncbi:MAG: CBS domain-containing protein [Clostridiales bacterium]|nr:CBS domain-containing protein [Clostridiales bacterium]
MLVKDIMTTNVISVKKEQKIENAVKILMDNNFSGMPVVDVENKVIGVITEGDLIYRSKKLRIPTFFTILDSYIFLESMKNLEKQIKKMVGYRVEDVMTVDVITVTEDTTVEEIATIMTRKKINRVPVVKEGVLVGVVSRRDIIKAYARE